MSLLFKD